MAPSRRTVLTTGAAGFVTAAASANAQTTGQGSPPQPMRPGRGGTDPGPRNLPIEQQNPDIFVSPATGPRHRGEPQISVLGLAHAARARRLDPDPAGLRALEGGGTVAALQAAGPTIAASCVASTNKFLA